MYEINKCVLYNKDISLNTDKYVVLFCKILKIYPDLLWELFLNIFQDNVVLFKNTNKVSRRSYNIFLEIVECYLREIYF